MGKQLLWLACLLSISALAQTPTFKANTDLIQINVRVTDGRGRNAVGLVARDFTVLEDGVAKSIAFFAAERQPVSLGILLDTSSSMRVAGKTEVVKTALRELLAAGNPKNEVFYMEFGDAPGDIVELTHDPQRLSAALSNIAGRRAGTAVYDAVAVALCRLKTARYMRQVLVVITDGADQHSRLKLDELIRIVQSSRAQVYVIGDFSPEEREIYRARNDTLTLVSGRQVENPILVLERVARESGATSYLPDKPGGVQRAIREVASELQTQYTLAYYPTQSTKPYRRIQVKVDQHKLKVFTRRGFSTADVGAHFSANNCAISPREHPYPYESKLVRHGDRIVYREDFSDPRSGWPFNDSCGYGSSEYHITRKGAIDSLGEGSVCAFGPWWNDIRASVSVKSPTAVKAAGWTTASAAGLVFRLNDNGYYALLVGAMPELYAKLIAKQFNQPHEVDLTPWTPVDQSRRSELREWNRLRVECHGDVLTLFINDLRVAIVKDARFGDGYVGLTLFGPGHAVFRDLIAEDWQPREAQH